MNLLSRIHLTAAAGILVVWAGCRAPLALNRSLVLRGNAFQNKNLLGVWQLQPHGVHQPVQPIVFVYPLGKRRFLITCCKFRPAASPGGRQKLRAELTGTFIGSLTQLHGRWWMSCRSMDPRFIYSPAMEAWWQTHNPVGQPTNYAAALKKAGLASARTSGMARIFFLVKLRKVSPNRLALYPLLVPQNGHQAPFAVPTTILQSRKKLRAFLNKRTLAHLLPKRPVLLKRLSTAQAEPYLPSP
ncbi:MAG: hypothetical protein HKL95_09860 [Phycisphaerae bacterium]|nr:hypothetical protein [Phycisphaerae bacterium]